MGLWECVCVGMWAYVSVYVLACVSIGLWEYVCVGVCICERVYV